MFLTVKQVADALSVCQNTVYREVERGRIPAYKIGRNIRIREEELEGYIAAQTVQPAPAASRPGKSPVWKPGMKVRAHYD